MINRFAWPFDLRHVCGIALLCVAPFSSGQNSYSLTNAEHASSNFRVATAAPLLACNALRRMQFPDMTVVAIAEVPAGPEAPAHCRVRGIIAPEIQFEVSLPAQWNRRLYMHGNGGFAGESFEQPAGLAYRRAALRYGFATAVTNGGHDGRLEPNATFAFKSMQKRIDYGYRAVHLTALVAKQLIAAYYDRSAAYSYFDGCSNGGRQAMMAAQRFPGDFDGVVAGAPLMNFSDSAVAFLWLARALRETAIPAGKMSWLANAVFKRCDARDGLVDQLLSDPRQCDFKPARDLNLCATQQGGECFTATEITTLSKIYGGPQSNGKPYFHGQLPGAEAVGVTYLPPYPDKTGWSEWVDDARGTAHVQTMLGEQFIKYLAFPTQNPDASVGNFDFDKGPAQMSMGREFIDAMNPDLSAFQARGGKLLMYFGWADPSVNPLGAIDYYEQLSAIPGSNKQDFARLFLMPGVFHCFGGYGPDRLDAMTAVIDWVEQGKAPDAIVATKTETHLGGKVIRERPICAYPQVAKYQGKGSVNQAANFRCE